ncbi:hypothetical protein FAUST_4246 [Fusarium austroamericanum]|uniref:Uncharacterized protein n=1 Tax=Fusarium austroamericanum TaxID=282268 RepID=A0AAN6C3J6_FUSAU|nr:hypothetical protein FAUST_4246 [Fusarium austroamericanum]
MDSSRGTTYRQDKTSSDSTSKDDKPVVDKGQASPLLDWFNQKEKDDPWHRFSVASTETHQDRSQEDVVHDKLKSWSTRAEFGSDKGK